MSLSKKEKKLWCDVYLATVKAKVNTLNSSYCPKSMANRAVEEYRYFKELSL